MDHAVFVERVQDSSLLWGVRSFHKSTFVVWGWGLSLQVLAVTVGILTPTLVLFCYSISRGEFLASLWCIPCLLGFFSGKPNLNFGEIVILIAIGCVGYFLPRTLWYAIACVVPLFGYVALGAHKGITMMELQEELCRSEQSYDRLVNSGLLITGR